MRTIICLVALASCVGTEADLDDKADAITRPNDEHAFRYFVGKGLTDNQAAAIVGNLDQESGMNPAARQPNGPGRGIAQWSVDQRWVTLVAYANSVGQSPTSLDLQLDFIWREFPSYGLATLQRTTTLEAATHDFMVDYEKCGNCQEPTRLTYARAALAAFGGHHVAPLDEVAFQANTSALWAVGAIATGGIPLGMAENTSPSIVQLANGGYEIAFQANTGNLWTFDSLTGEGKDWHLGLAPGTSPSIAALPDGTFEVAFHAASSTLWTVGAEWKDWGISLLPGTSPSIAALAHGGYEVAFQYTTTALYTVGNGGSTLWPLGMMAGTSPSIAGLSDGSYEVAFQANDTSLWTVGSTGNSTNWHLGLDRASSPSIAAVPGGFQVAFQSNNHALWIVGTNAPGGLPLGMKPGTSPSLSRIVPGKAYFQANTGVLWNTVTGNMSYGMTNSTSPAGT